MPRNLVLADADTGYGIVSWLIETYKSDLALVVTTGVNDISDLCQRAGVPTEVYRNDTTVAEALLAQREPIDLAFTLWWPKLVRQPLLQIPRRGCVNTHPSLLPHGRGKHSNFWMIVEEAPFGVTLHLLDEGVDTGPLIAQKAIPYGLEDTGETLYRAAKKAMPRLSRLCYKRIRTGDLNGRPQVRAQGAFIARTSSTWRPASSSTATIRAGSFSISFVLALLQAFPAAVSSVINGHFGSASR